MGRWITGCYVAKLETRNFSFEGYGTDESYAKIALLAGLRQHGKEYGLGEDWYHEFADDIHTHRIVFGRCYRDDESIIKGRDSE